MSDERDKFGHPKIENDRGNAHQAIRDSYNVNASLPWIVIAIAAAFLALGIAIGGIIISKLESDHVQERLTETTKQYRLLDNDWQITNAWLAAHGIKRDIHGNLYIEGERHE